MDGIEEQKGCISVPEMAKRLGVSRSYAYVVAAQEGFPTIHVGKRVLIPVRGFEEWMKRNNGMGEW